MKGDNNEGTSKNKDYNLFDVPKLVQIAREQSFIGNYECSLGKYQIALRIIQKRYSELTERLIKQNWKMTESNIKLEIAQTAQMLELCKKLQCDYFDYGKKQYENEELNQRKSKQNNIMVFDFNDSKSNNINKRRSQPNISHFGNKKPFTFNNQTNSDPFEDFKHDPFDTFGQSIDDLSLDDNVSQFKGKRNSAHIRKNIKNKSPFKPKPNKKRNSYSDLRENLNVNNPRSGFVDSKKEVSLVNPLEEFNMSTSNMDNATINSTILTENNNNISNINNNTFLNEIHNHMAKNNYINMDNNIIKSRTKNFNKNTNSLNNKLNKIPIIMQKKPTQIKSQLNKTPVRCRNYNIPNNNINKNANSNTDKKKPRKTGSMKESNSKAQKENLNESGKSKFLLERYPNSKGNGPDTELIEMLEREVVDTNPNVKFDDIADLESAKKTLQETVFLPLIIPEFFKGIRRAWRGVLLYGPPGTGKTLLAKALATQGKTTFFNVHSSSFASKWRGESEKLVRLLFEMARYYAPTTIFIDEIDSLCSKRGDSSECESSRRVKSEFLVQMDGVSTNNSDNNKDNDNKNNENKSEENRPKIVTVMAATNRPWDLDEAVRRRFEKRIYIPLPNDNGRKQMFKINLKNIKIDGELNYDILVKKSDGYSGADIANVCREAAFMPMRKNMELNGENKIEDLISNEDFMKNLNSGIKMSDLIQALNNISKSVGSKDLEVFEKWTKEFKSV